MKKLLKGVIQDPTVAAYLAKTNPDMYALEEEQSPAFNEMDELKSSQADLEKAYGNQMFMEGAEKINSALSGTQYKPGSYNSLVDGAKSKSANVKQMAEANERTKKQALEDADRDPNSEVNKRFQERMKAINPQFADLTIADYKSSGGDLMKMMEARNQREADRAFQEKQFQSQQANSDRDYNLRKQQAEWSRSNDSVAREIQSKQMALQERIANATTADKKAQLELEYKKLEQQKSMIDTTGEKEIKKELAKQEIKDNFAEAKEKRKSVAELDKAIPQLEDQINRIRKAKQVLAQQTGVGTGPIDQYTNKMFPQGQALQQAINDIGLHKMTQMFQGMSKAIDSDSERRFFESTLPNMGNYESVNMKILDDMEKNAQSLINKSRAKLAEKSGTSVYPKQVRKGNQVTTVENEAEEAEAKSEGWE